MAKFMRLVNILSRCHSLYRADRLREETLYPWHYNYVIPVCLHPGMSQEQLARHVCADKCNVTRHLSRLEEMGYIQRRPSEQDKRATLVYPTPMMEEMLPKVRQINREWSEYILDGLTDEEIGQLEDTLLKIARRAKEYVNSKDELDP